MLLYLLSVDLMCAVRVLCTMKMSTIVYIYISLNTITKNTTTKYRIDKNITNSSVPFVLRQPYDMKLCTEISH